MIRRLSTKDKISFIDYCQDKIINAQQKFWQIIKRSGICYILDTGSIHGIMFVEKIDNRRFLKILVNDSKSAYNLLRNFLWNQNFLMFWELENNSNLTYLTRKFKFFEVEKKENSIIYCRKPWMVAKEQNNGNSNYSQYNRKD